MDPIIREPQTKAQACLIWMHGLGADANDMSGVAAQMNWSTTSVRHVFMNAPIRPVTINNGMRMPAWYDITGTTLTAREDEAGIRASAADISETIRQQYEQGIPQTNIYLCGFSQGGAMALYTGLQETESLGGIIALSAYLPLAHSIIPQQSRETPIFIGAGRFDPIVLPQWTDASEQWLRSSGYQQLTSHRYAMEHNICMEEISDLQNWLEPLLARSTQ